MTASNREIDRPADIVESGPQLIDDRQRQRDPRSHDLLLRSGNTCCHRGRRDKEEGFPVGCSSPGTFSTRFPDRDGTFEQLQARDDEFVQESNRRTERNG